MKDFVVSGKGGRQCVIVNKVQSERAETARSVTLVAAFTTNSFYYQLKSRIYRKTNTEHSSELDKNIIPEIILSRNLGKLGNFQTEHLLLFQHYSLKQVYNETNDLILNNLFQCLSFQVSRTMSERDKLIIAEIQFAEFKKSCCSLFSASVHLQNQ